MPKCKNCAEPFNIPKKDIEYYNSLKVPPPTFCPACRQQRRYAIRNERTLYKRTCDSCNENILSMYSGDKPFPIYCQDCWWKDDWDATSFGQDFDFSKPFFEQFEDLQNKVPRIALYTINTENSDYCNFLGDVKNSYLIFGSVYSEDCMYGSPYYSKNCVDTLVLRNCELCYECTDCRKLYNSMFCQDCNNSNDLLFCYDLQSCSDCIACAGLRNKKYHIENKAYSKEDYLAYKSKLNLSNPEQMKELKEKLEKIKLAVPHHYMPNKSAENVSGNHIYNSKNTFNSFYTDNCEDCSYCAQVVDLKKCYDNNYTEENEFCLEYLGMYGTKNALYSTFSRHTYSAYYSEYCISSKYLFGCDGIRNKEYCILNKQYTKEEYEKLLPQIIEHMKSSGEWGEFFPISRSPFGYNETVAQEYFPLTKEQILEKNYKWKAPDPREFQPQTFNTPQDIKDVPDSITNEILACKNCKINYKIIKQELKFYRERSLPIPNKCPNCRHKDRLALRNPYKLNPRNCDKCKNNIQSTYSPNIQEKIYCEKCYLEEIY